LTLLQRLGIVLDHLPIVESSPGQPEPASWSRTLVWANEEATAGFARWLAQQPDVLDAVVALRGDLGAGKTTCVRHLLRALGVSGRIKSPTYAVVEPYTVTTAAGRGQHAAYHFDFYRFSDPREWEDAGFRELFAGPGLKLCEWPDQAAGLMPVADLDITLSLQDDERRLVHLQAHTPRGARLLPTP
jgi:tRNA threonylcarbamoyladenosine biosynthesis protein TsaE